MINIYTLALFNSQLMHCVNKNNSHYIESGVLKHKVLERKKQSCSQISCSVRYLLFLMVQKFKVLIIDVYSMSDRTALFCKILHKKPVPTKRVIREGRSIFVELVGHYVKKIIRACV